MQSAGGRPAAGQRHHVTVLFSDLCGSTLLGRRIEPEEFDRLVGMLRDAVDAEAQRRGGLMVRAQGDGTVVLFGYPHACEDDGLRAAEVALAVHERVARIAAASPEARSLAVRSGIHSGISYISRGDMRLGVLDLQGDVVNTTAHLQQLAEPGAIVASRAVLGPHANMFDLRALPPPADPAHDDKLATRRKLPPGLDVVQVLRRRGLARRYDATAQRGLTPLMGRDAELAFLRQCVRLDDPAAPRCAVIQAGAGLGKTRLLEEFTASTDLSAWTVLRGNCESFGAAEVLQPFVQMGRAQRVASNTSALFVHFSQLCREGPVLLLIDDWQWADDASRQLMMALLQVPDGPRVILASRLREDGNDWIAGAPHLTLQPFGLAQTDAAVRRWMPEADPFLVQRIHEYAGGVPLFVEELCHSASQRLWESLEGQGPVQTWLRTLVASRLARQLEPAKVAVVQAAAVIGYEIPRDLLDAVTSPPPDDALLRALAEADFLYADPDGRTLRFKHGITRDAVYEAIGLYERMALHELIERVLLERAARDPHAEEVEALGYHAGRAGHWERAAHYAERAGDRAIGTHALDRGRAHYQEALEALDHLAPTPEHLRNWCLVANKLGMACIFDPLSLGDAVSRFEQAVARARELGDDNVLARCEYWLGYIRYGLGDFRAGRAHAEEGLRLATGSGDRRLAIQIEATLGQILAAMTDYDGALALMDEAVAVKREQSRVGGGVAIGSAYTLACKGSVLADRGDFAQAQECFDAAMQLLGGSTHPVGNSVRNWIAISLVWQGRWQEAQAVAIESARIGENTRALLLLAVSRAVLGFARWRAGDAEGLQQLRAAAQWITARRSRFFISLFHGWLCEAAVEQGDLPAARHAAARVLWRVRAGERLGEAVACRAMALAAAQQGDAPAAARWLARADASAACRASHREAARNAQARAQLQRLLPGLPAQQTAAAPRA